VAAGASATVVDAFLASILNDASFTAYGPVYVQLHVGAPGAAGTSNVATESTRESAGSNSAFAAPSGGATTNLNAITWTSVAASETYTYVSLWSASSGGVFIASGSITANAVATGDTFTIPASDMAISMAVAA
jgi:outer membrane usher protein FimD/PapC